jgi:hypothetical protein
MRVQVRATFCTLSWVGNWFYHLNPNPSISGLNGELSDGNIKVTDFWNTKDVVLVDFLASGDNGELTAILTVGEV